jgi:hypothetical protein
MESQGFGNVQHLQNAATTQEISSVSGFTMSLIVVMLISLLKTSTGVFLGTCWAWSGIIGCVPVDIHKKCVFYIYIVFLNIYVIWKQYKCKVCNV